MNETLSSELKRLEKAFESIEQATPFLKSMVNAFKEVAISRAVLKARRAETPDIHILPPDRSRFAEGYPWLTENMIASLMDPWGENVKFTMLPLAIAFPGIASAVLHLRDAFEQGKVNLEDCISALVEGREEDITKTASYLGFQPVVFKFILGQMLKPFVEKRTESLRHFIKNLPWHQGYCPICGAFPELSFLISAEGQRWLRCSLCSYEWRFDRMSCPYCGKQNQDKEFTCISGVEHQWVELCPDCHRYIVGIDLRQHAVSSIDVAAIGMIHLDMISQQRGFFPAAECAWNMVS